jgi:sialic acid synthase SpsE
MPEAPIELDFLQAESIQIMKLGSADAVNAQFLGIILHMSDGQKVLGNVMRKKDVEEMIDILRQYSNELWPDN